ncbi:MAG: endolytic transglycosylase MltG [Roseivirga sp.]|nr:endolytic transglycosylase MltG [Roseivirga sp.]
MRKRKIFMIVMVLFSVLLTTFTFYFYQMFKGANILLDKPDMAITIEKGETFSELRAKLYDAQIVQEAVSFSFVAKVLDYQEAVKPGVYVLKSGMSNLDAVRMLRAGAQVPVRITFNNVRLKNELAEKITVNTGVKPSEFEALLSNEDFLADYGLNADNSMSVFIPDTYEVYWTITPEELFDKMHKAHEQFWNAGRRQKAQALNLTPVEVSILASIVQAETIMSDERSKVAGLYLNRLRKNMYLQADPTVKYALGDFAIQRILTKDTRVNSPYNTYVNRGLPPGPINLASIASIQSVLDFQKHDYLYMCAKEDFSGYHSFAETLSEHNRNASKLHKALNQRRIYR